MDEDVLELENRRKIYQLVSKFPGMYLREIEKKLGLAMGVLEYNISYLEKREILTVEREGNRKRYFVGDHCMDASFKCKGMIVAVAFAD